VGSGTCLVPKLVGKLAVTPAGRAGGGCGRASRDLLGPLRLLQIGVDGRKPVYDELSVVSVVVVVGAGTVVVVDVVVVVAGGGGGALTITVWMAL